MRTLLILALLLVITGCGDAPEQEPQPPSDTPPAPVDDEGPSTVGSGGRFGD